MRDPRLRLLPATLLALTLAVELTAVALSWGLESRYDTILYAVYAATLAGAGALVASRQPRNPIGWLFLAFALAGAVMADAAQGWALQATERGWRGGDTAELLASAGRQPSGLCWILTFLLIPDGRLPSRRWRLVVLAAAVGTVLTIVGWSLDEDLYDFPSGHNPFAVEGLPTGALFGAGVSLMIAALLAAAASLVLRFRRARSVERQQLKWFALAAGVAAVVLPISFALWYVTSLAPVLIAVALTALPIGACVAILRYRLYEIDLVINRTLVYGAVTVILAAAFAATAVLLGTLLGRGTGWATAGATLVVAVVFRPLRMRVQDLVDRRFNRARYDAVHRMSTFLEALRDGAAAPEEVEGVLRVLMADPRLELLFLPAESEHYVDARGGPRQRPRGRHPATDPDRARRPAARHGAPRPAEARAARPAAQARRGRRAGDRDRATASRATPPTGRGRGLARADRRGRRRRAPPASSATSTTAPSSGSSRSGSRYATPSTSSGRRRRARRRRPSTARSPRSPLRSTSCASSRAGCAPSQLDGGLGAGPPRARPPGARTCRGRRDRASGSPDDVEAAAYFVACEGLTNAVKHAHATKVVLSARRGDERQLVVIASPTTASAARVAQRVRAARALRSRRGPRRHDCGSSSAPGAGHDADRGAAVRVVIAEDQAAASRGPRAAVRATAATRCVAALGDADRAAGRGRASTSPTSSSSTSGCRRPSPTRARAPRSEIKETPSRTSACSSSPSTSRRRHAVALVDASAASATCSRTACSKSASSSPPPNASPQGGSALDPKVVASLVSTRGDHDPLAQLTDARTRRARADGRGPHQRRHRQAPRTSASAPSRHTSATS